MSSPAPLSLAASHCRRHRLRHPPLSLRLGTLLLLAAVAPLAPAATYYVGNGDGCYPNLATALTAAAADPEAEIRLTHDTLHRTVQQTISRSIVLRGGFASCTAPAPLPGVQSLLFNPDGRTLVVNGGGSGPRRQLSAEQITFIGQRYWNGGGTAPGGVAGGIQVAGPVDVRLRRGTMQVVHASGAGGAIRMEPTPAGAPEVVLEDMEISLASSETHGGAVYCKGGRLRLLRSSIGDSYAAQDGGAIHAEVGCHVELTDGALRDNAGRIGGAVYVGGSLAAHRALIAGNTASSAGGGISMTGGTAMLEDVKFIDNRSIGGAAINAYEGSVLMGGRMCTLAEAVSRGGPRCSSISKHAVGLDHTVIGLRNSVMSLTNTTLAANSSTAARASLIRTRESDLVIQNSVLAANSKLKAAYVDSDTDRLLLLEQVSFHGNTAGGPGNSHILITGSANRFLATNSILMFNGYPLLEGGTSVVLRCIVADQPVSASGGMRQTIDPGIADDGVHLRGDSVAIDFCEPNLTTDGDGDNRPFDVPTVPNPSASRIADAGADEYHPGGGAERIHSDGFES